MYNFRGATYSDNREIEGRIFHLAKEFQVPLFEKDPIVEKNIQNLYRVAADIQLSYPLLFRTSRSS